MDLQKWPELLYIYGPYAIVVFFVAVMLYLIRQWHKDPPKDQAQKLLYVLYILGSGIIVSIGIGFIFVNWPPTTIYRGSLGVYAAEPTKFFSVSSELFIKSTPTSDGRLQWEYVVVVRQPAEVGEFDFAYQWGPGTKEEQDYKLELTELKRGHTKVKPDPDQPGKLFYDSGDPEAPKRPMQIADVKGLSKPIAPSGILVAVANAQERLRTNILLNWLDSSDPNLRAQARAQLRQLSPGELRQLLSFQGLSDSARQQIDAQLRGR